MNGDDLAQRVKDADAVAAALPPDITIECALDVGGQGAVYRGRFEDRLCAVKIYFPGQLATRVDREIDALRMLDDPSVVRLLWSGTACFGGECLPVVVTEFVQGQTLSSLLRTQPLDLDSLGPIAYDVVTAVSVIWEHRIVHRDLKPANILVEPGGRACVIDLGVARHVDRTTLTALGLTWGTLGYMSPEQTNAVRQLTCKSDLFALGVILIEASLGAHPTRGDQLRLLASQPHLNLSPPISDWEFAPVVRRLLMPHAVQRPMPAVVLEQLDQFKR